MSRISELVTDLRDMVEATSPISHSGLWYGFLRDKEGYAIRMVGPASKGQVERTLKGLNAKTDLDTESFSVDYAMTDFRSDLQDGISALQFKRLPPDDKRRLVHLMDLYQVRHEGKSKAPAKLKGKKLDAEINRLYGIHAHGVQVNIMDLSKIANAAKAAYEAGEDMEAALKVAIAKYRVN